MVHGLLASKFTKKPFLAGAEGLSSAPDPAGGAYDAPTDPLIR